MADPEHVAITSSTYFPTWYQGPLRSIKHTDKIRGDLALEFVEKALIKGYWVVITDGFSTKTFQKKLSSLNTGKLIIIKRRAKGRSMARRLAFQRATRIPAIQAILYTEAEKVSLIDYIPELVQPIIKGGVLILLFLREKLICLNKPIPDICMNQRLTETFSTMNICICMDFYPKKKPLICSLDLEYLLPTSG